MLLVPAVLTPPASGQGTDAVAGGPDAVANAPGDLPVYRVDRVSLDATTRAPVAPFALFGLHLPAPPAGEVHIRFSDDGAWGPWLELPAGHGPDRHTGEGQGNPAYVSEPVWVGRADGWELDLASGRVPLEGAEVILVRDSGAREAVGGSETDESPTRAPGAPTIRSRSWWGARPYRGDLEIADHLQLAVVHHSVSANSYSSSEVPGMIKAIQVYHQDGNGWDDIAYNFVVDRFGTIWEGRQGGTDQAVIGGHAKGFNTGSTGVVALGEYGSASPSTAMVNSIGTLLGWKLFVHGVDPDGRTQFTSYGNETYPEGRTVDLPRVVGHRDTGATACPGHNLYGRLSTIRAAATAGYDSRLGTGAMAGRSLTINGTYTPLPGDFTGDGRQDIIWYAPGSSADYLWRGKADGSFTSTPLSINGTYQPLIGDFTGDGTDDVIWYGPGSSPDNLWLARGDGSFKSAPLSITATYQPLVGEFSGDDVADVIWYRPGGASDWLWKGTERGVFRSSKITINGTYRPVVADVDGNWVDDIVWYAPGTAGDVIWLGWEGAKFSPRSIKVDQTFTPVAGEFDGDGDWRSDIFWFGPGGAYDTLWSATSDGRFPLGGHPLGRHPSGGGG